MTRLIWICFLIACNKPTHDHVARANLTAATVIDMVSPWQRTTLTPGAPTGLYRGADGVSGDQDGCLTTAWEEGGIVTRACPTADTYSTELVASGLIGVEDARAADIDGDGVVDVVSGSDSGGRVYITYRGVSPTAITLTQSMAHGRVMQVAIADINHDGNPDILFGTRVAAPAVVAWLENPGAASRIGTAWTYHEISHAGWVMSIIPIDVDRDGDIDVVVSDRTNYKDANGITKWDLYGARWEEQTESGWLNHAISQPAGACVNCTPGDEMFLSLADIDGDGSLDVIDCTSSGSRADSRIVVHHNSGNWIAWTHTVIPPVANVGHCQGVIADDVDRDARLDLVVSTWKGNAYPLSPVAAELSGVYWLRNVGDGSWARGEISGSIGGKFDNVVVSGDCLITSEQLDPPGGLGVIKYCPPE